MGNLASHSKKNWSGIMKERSAHSYTINCIYSLVTCTLTIFSIYVHSQSCTLSTLSLLLQCPNASSFIIFYHFIPLLHRHSEEVVSQSWNICYSCKMYIHKRKWMNCQHKKNISKSRLLQKCHTKRWKHLSLSQIEHLINLQAVTRKYGCNCLKSTQEPTPAAFTRHNRNNRNTWGVHVLVR